MLKKLMKHEYKATARFFLPAYGIFAALLAVQRLSLIGAVQLEKVGGLAETLMTFFMGLVTVVTVLGLMAMAIAPFVYAVIRFWRNMLGDEGYLSFTLPVSTGKNVMAKLLVAGTWFVVTSVVTVLCGILYGLTIDAAAIGAGFASVGEAFSRSLHMIGGWTIVFVVLMLLAVLSQLARDLMTVYSSMSIGQMASHHKLLASAGAYVGIGFITATILQVVMVCAAFLYGDSIVEFMNAVTFSAVDGAMLICSILLVIVLYNMVIFTIHFFLSRHFLTKKLNLA